MKRTIFVAVVVALILGLCFTGFSALADNDTGKNATGPSGTRQIELADELTLEPDDSYRSEWLDVKQFRFFKLYAYLMPYELDPEPDGELDIMFRDSATGVDSEAYDRRTWDEWIEWYRPPNEHWSAVHEFDGLYSYIRFRLDNTYDENITISLYLLMTDEGW